METAEVKKQVLERCPPGDCWTDVDGSSPIFDSLTDGLEYVFQKTKCTEFHLSSFEGKVYVVDTEEIEEPEPVRFSLYGEH